MTDGRADLRVERSRNRWRLAAVLLAVLLALVGWVAVADPGQPSPAALISTTTSRPLPEACADALALADQVTEHARRLAIAAVDHVVIMERLELFLDGKPGGISGKEAYELGAKQMAVMEEHGPDAEVRTKRYQEVRKRCSLK